MGMLQHDNIFQGSLQIKECLFDLLCQVFFFFFKKGFDVKVLDLQEYFQNIIHDIYKAFNCIIITVIKYSMA